MTSTAESRQGLVDLTTLANRELAGVWGEVGSLPPREARDVLTEVLPVLAREYGVAAGALAADWYDTLRDEHGARGAFRAEPVDVPDDGRYAAMARFSVTPLFGAAPDADKALTLAQGGLQRVVANGHRLTVVGSTNRDKAAEGWRRVGSGSNCSFCRMLIDRGAVYKADTAAFKSHDHCNCMAAPAFGGGATVSSIAYTASKARTSDADRARVRKYLRDNYSDA